MNVTIGSAVNLPFLLEAELNNWGSRSGPQNRESVHSLRSGCWKGKAQEGQNQASSIPSTKPTSERRPSHSRSDFLPESWSGNEGGQTEAALVGPSWKHETSRNRDLPFTLCCFVYSSLVALLSGLEEQLTGQSCPLSEGLGSQYQPLFPLGILLGTRAWQF